MLSPKRILRLRGIAPSDISPKRLTPWLNSMLVVLLAWTLAQTTWRYMPEGDFAPVLLSTPTVKQPSGSRPSVSLDQVATLHLFGKADEKPSAVDKAPISAPETRLNLTLKGVVAIASQQEALAIIAQGQRDEQAYRVGDTIPGGAVLHEILPDRVILKRGGRFETLTLPKERADTAEPSDLPAVNTTRRRMGNLQGRAPGSGPQLQEIRDRILNNPQEALQLINAQPVMDGGQLKGYRVNPGRDRRLFNSVGLRPGDVVTNVNGIPLNDPTQMGRLFEQLTSARRLDVTVERGGTQSRLSLDLEQQQ